MRISSPNTDGTRTVTALRRMSPEKDPYFAMVAFDVGARLCLARQMFERMGDNCVPDYWGKPVIFAYLRNLAETGKRD